MKSLYLLLNTCSSILDYDIVEEKPFFMKIIVYLDSDYDELVINYRGRNLLITIYSYSIFVEKHLYLELKNRIRKIKYSVKNGILELNIYFKILF